MIEAPASFRGVAFAVTQTDFVGGRRQAVHTYPGKDIHWVEDMGRALRRFRLRGFVLDGSVKLGRASIAMQRSRFIEACEKKGPGILVHPTLGSLTVSVYPFSISEGLDASNYSEVSLECVETGVQTFPQVSAEQPSTTTKNENGVNITRTAVPAASRLKKALIQQAKNTVYTLISGGSLSTSSLLANATGLLSLAGVQGDLVAQLAGWTAKILLFARDATALYRIAAVLPTSSEATNGRYSAGNNTGLTGTNPSPYARDTSLDDLISDASVLRNEVRKAAQAVNSGVLVIDLGDITDLAMQVIAMVDALLDCCADPADAIRILLDLIATLLAGPSTSATRVVDMMIWHAAVAALANAVATYQPSSTNDAAARIAQIDPVLDALANAAADAGEDDLYDSIKECRTAIVSSLRNAAATIAALTTFNLPRSLPALLLSQQIYGDASRSDQLVSQVDPPHPLFFPLSFEALSS